MNADTLELRSIGYQMREKEEAHLRFLENLSLSPQLLSDLSFHMNISALVAIEKENRMMIGRVDSSFDIYGLEKMN